MNVANVDQEQTQLLADMIEAERRLPRQQRESFHFFETLGGAFLTHPGMGERAGTLRSDILCLGEAGLLRLSPMSGSGFRIDITPAGYRFHAESVQNIAEPLEHLERELQRHFDAEAFQSRYQDAYAKWSSARRMLYAEDADDQLTRIGHDCTEAMQSFATALVLNYNPPSVDPNPGLYIKRLDAVIDLFKAKVGAKRNALLHALVNYWVAAGAIAERQEHGADKDGDPVTWEDARRVVFHTAIVMFEIDRTLS